MNASIIWINILSEVFSGIISIIAVAGVVWLSYAQKPIPATLMILVGAVTGAFFALKGASGTVAAVRTMVAAKDEP